MDEIGSRLSASVSKITESITETAKTLKSILPEVKLPPKEVVLKKSKAGAIQSAKTTYKFASDGLKFTGAFALRRASNLCSVLALLLQIPRVPGSIIGFFLGSYKSGDKFASIPTTTARAAGKVAMNLADTLEMMPADKTVSKKENELHERTDQYFAKSQLGSRYLEDAKKLQNESKEENRDIIEALCSLARKCYKEAYEIHKLDHPNDRNMELLMKNTNEEIDLIQDSLKK